MDSKGLDWEDDQHRLSDRHVLIQHCRLHHIPTLQAVDQNLQRQEKLSEKFTCA
jgi:hypothetical protein